MEIQGSVAWITGGISGIGAACAEELHKNGAKLILSSRRLEEGLEFAKRFGDDAIFAQADVKNYRELDAAVTTGIEKFGKLDFLINCAGCSGFESIFVDDVEDAESSHEMFDEVVRTNLYGTYYAAQAAASRMKDNKPNAQGERGNIIFIASMASDKVFNFFDERVEEMFSNNYAFAYGASKAGILGLSRDIAIVLAPYGIRVNTIKPGYFETPMTDNPVTADIYLPMQLFPKVGGNPAAISTLAAEIIRNVSLNRAEFAIDAGIVG